MANKKVDFYILAANSAMKAQLFACRMLENLHQAQKSVYVHTSTREEAERLDNMLWTYRDESFVAHQIYQAEAESAPLIQIGYGEKSPAAHILMNLSRAVPAFYQQYEEIIEIVFADPLMQQLARDRFRHYRTENCMLTTHKLELNDDFDGKSI